MVMEYTGLRPNDDLELVIVERYVCIIIVKHLFLLCPERRGTCLLHALVISTDD